jgi:molecular chaperone GrpE
VSKKRIPIRTQPSTAKEAAEPAPAVAAEDAIPEQVPEPGVGPEQAGGPKSDSAATGAPEAELAQVRAELEAAKDRALRCQAELENYRRRVAREMELERRYAALPLLRDLLPVWDNVHRAIEAGRQSGDDPALLKGFEMVAEQLEDTLRRHDCLSIEALWQPFDPNLHEAITQQPSEEHPPGTVIGETQTGFRLHDRVVRPSQVIVSAAMSSDDG